jgi:glycosyltransferase involved in cell wall biosynthesis
MMIRGLKRGFKFNLLREAAPRIIFLHGGIGGSLAARKNTEAQQRKPSSHTGFMANRKKIALCLEYPLALRGGVSVLVENLLGGLGEQYEMVLVSPDTAGELEKSPLSRFIAKHFEWNPAAVSRSTSRQLANRLAENKVDLAHFHFGGNFGWGNRFPGQCPVPYAAGLGIKTCSTVHLVVNALDGFCGPQKPLWFKLGMLPVAWTGKMRVLGSLKSEIAVSQHDCGKLRRWYWPLRGRFRVIYHSRIRRDSRPAAMAREPMILNVGHIARRKGQGLLAEAFAQIAPRHPDWKLWLVGHVAEADEENRIRETARRHGLEQRIVFAGQRDDAFSLMNRAGIYVQPSYAEALGLALQEAMFCGCPSIGTRIGGIPELIEDGKTGLLVEAGQPDLLARALESLIANPALRENYGRAAAASILERGMTLEQMLSNHVQLYESILGGQ